MSTATPLPIDETLLEEAAQALALLPALEVEPALARLADEYARRLVARHADLPSSTLAYNGRHFAQQAARRARQVILSRKSDGQTQPK